MQTLQNLTINSLGHGHGHGTRLPAMLRNTRRAGTRFFKDKEVHVKMKKTLLALTIMLTAAALVAVFWGSAMAQVTGQCSNCHTMHYSQHGLEPGDTDFPTLAPYDKWASGGPFGSLVVNDCRGCHTTTGDDPFVDGYPYVKSSVTLANYLAGGYFTDGGGSHNDESHTLDFGELPVGYETDFSSNGDWYEGDTSTTGLTCAGSSGCHGLETTANEAEAIAGGHHGNNIELGWRLLTVGNLPLLGKDTYTEENDPKDYEEALNAASTPTGDEFHNLYSGGTVATGKSSISKLCGKCHGEFHSDTQNTGGEWIRHPTDVALPGDWEIPTDGDSYTADDYKNNPVGTPTAILSVAGGGADTVYATCLSCHRAHGSDVDDILRWGYDTQQADSSTTYGCLGCHNKQRHADYK